MANQVTLDLSDLICPPDVKRTNVFQELYTLNSHYGSGMNPLQSLQHLETSVSILQHSKTLKETYNIQNLCSKTDISKTAWINV